MSRLAKRQKLQEEQAAEEQAAEEQAAEEQAAETFRTILPTTLMLVTRSHLKMLVAVNLFRPQDLHPVPYNFVTFPLPSSKQYIPQDHDNLLLAHAKRLRLVGCGIRGMLMRLIMLDVSRSMHTGVRRVTAVLAAEVRNGYVQEAEELCASAQFQAAMLPLGFSILLGDLPSLAHMAWLLVDGKAYEQEVARSTLYYDRDRAFEYVQHGAKYDCQHCIGMMACCLINGYGVTIDDSRGQALACNSSARGSKYGQVTLGIIFQFGVFGLGVGAPDFDQALALFRLAAAQGFDEGQLCIARMYRHGHSVPKHKRMAIHWYELAARAGNVAARAVLASDWGRA
jgi:hypothetical protein